MKYFLTLIILLSACSISCESNIFYTDNPADSAVHTLLPNGMAVLVKQMPQSKFVSLTAFVKSGSAQEADFNGSGISHFVEHMIFKGTSTRPLGSIESEIANMGGEINGFTTYDYTGFQITVPNKHFHAALKILKDILTSSSFDPAEINKERSVIIKEIKMNEDDPDRLLSKLIHSKSYFIHPYQNPVIGYEDVFNKITREDIIRFYKDRYIPNNMLISIAGGIAKDDAYGACKEQFADFNRESLPNIVLPEEPPSLDKKDIEVRSSASIARVAIAFHTVRLQDADLYSLDILSAILGEGRNSRLYNAICKDALCYNVNTYNWTPKDPGLLVIEFAAKEENVQTAIKRIFAQIDAIKNSAVWRFELAKAKKKVIADYVFGMQTADEQSLNLAAGYALTGDINFQKNYVQKILKVTPQDVQNAAGKYLNQTNATIVKLLPAKTGQSELPSPTIESAAPDFKKQVLSNGATILARQDSTLPIISICAVFKGGLRSEESLENGISNLTASLILKGTKHYSHVSLDNIIESSAISLSPFSGKNSFGVSVQCLSTELDKALTVLSDILIYPEFENHQISLQKERLYGAIKADDDDIFRVGIKLLRQNLYKLHPYRLDELGSFDTLRSITRKDIINYFRKYYVSDNLVIAVSGDINPDEAIKKVSYYFKHMRMAPISIHTIVEPPLEASKDITKLVDKKQSLLLAGFRGSDIYDKKACLTLELIASILSGDSGLLFNEIRQKTGVSYTLGAISVSGIDPGYFVIYVATTKEKIALVNDTVFALLERIKRGQLPDESISRAKHVLIGRMEISLETNSGLAFKSAQDMLYGLGYDNYKNFAEDLNSISKEDIVKFSNKFLSFDKSVVINCLPKE